jgi:hypothetical protein
MPFTEPEETAMDGTTRQSQPLLPGMPQPRVRFPKRQACTRGDHTSSRCRDEVFVENLRAFLEGKGFAGKRSEALEAIGSVMPRFD